MIRAGAVLALVAACGPAQRPVDPTAIDQRMPASLIGEWRWVKLTEEAGTRRVEDEHWQFVPGGVGVVQGRYLRDVTVQSTDGSPFECNQATEYHQRAVFEVEVTAAVGAAIVRETGYRAEPSPCDHGFRKLGQYAATVGEQQAVLRWDDGEATLLRIGPPNDALLEPTWRGDHPEPLGAWAWSATWLEPRGPRKTATETWQIAPGPDDTLNATVTRTVETVDGDGATIACAGTDRWTLTERIALEAHREGEVLRFREVAVEATPHPCQRTSPNRILDDATVEQIGDFLVLEWRGDRRQVLSRP